MVKECFLYEEERKARVRVGGFDENERFDREGFGNFGLQNEGDSDFRI